MIFKIFVFFLKHQIKLLLVIDFFFKTKKYIYLGLTMINIVLHISIHSKNSMSCSSLQNDIYFGMFM